MGRPVNRWDSLFLSLDEWTAKGVRFRLSPDTQEMQYRDAAGVLAEWETDHLSYCKREFTEALRRRAGLCILCGMEQAKRPSPHGRRKEYNEETQKASWVPAEVPEFLMKHYEPILCDACWDTGGLEQWAGLTTGRTGRGRSAKSDKQRGGDGAEEISFPDEDGEAAPTTDAGADLFAGY